jgi:putative sugar O-methyltransferase
MNKTNDEFLGWTANPLMARTYVDTINDCVTNQSKYEIFRSGLHGYTPILEHVTYEGGLIYANYIIENYPHMLDKLEELKKNDNIGNPIKYHYDRFGEINPTTLRYIKFAGDIEKCFGNIENLNLVEIGGGYGGLIRILSTIFNFKSITLFDLPAPLQLQRKYLKEFGIEVNINTINDEIEIKKDTLVISNYAWCECDIYTRTLYKEKILKKADLNYLVVYDIDLDELSSMEGSLPFEKEILDRCLIYRKKIKSK